MTSIFKVGDFVKLTTLAKDSYNFKDYNNCVGEVTKVVYQPVQKNYVIKVTWLPTRHIQYYWEEDLKLSPLKSFI